MPDAIAPTAYLVGTDEAGYGPNLGPLVISATVWEVSAGTRPDDLYSLLSKVIVATPTKEDRLPDARRVAMADSKALYQSGKGLGLLERGVLAALALLHGPRARCADVWAALAPDAAETWRSIPWYGHYDPAMPLACEAATLGCLSEALRAGLAAAGVRLAAMRSRVVFEEEFNELVERHASKGAALSCLTLALAAQSIQSLPQRPVTVICDKHGGRNAYAPLLERAFPEALIEICGEGRERSVYRFGPQDCRTEFRFQMKAESYLPAALASMCSKYLRELSMLAFNEFWCRRVPGLCPTAGYPSDAKRFKDAIAAALAELGIEDRRIWRSR